jgi:DNA-binding NarL/FixJ family response regulator
MKVTNVLLISRHRLTTDGLRALFEAEDDVRVVGDATECSGAIELVRGADPDVAVIDLIVQVLNGLTVVRQLKRAAPTLRIVAISMCTDESYVSQALHDGASGYVLKSDSFSELLRAVHEVQAGRQYLSPTFNAGSIEKRRQRAVGASGDTFERLTPRERQVLQLAACGCTSAQIGARLGISRRTAETHRSNIYKKVLVESHTDLVALALRRGLLTRDA